MATCARLSERLEQTRDSVGFRVYRASRLEALLAPLEGLLAATRPENPLQPQTVIAAHPGMMQWLPGALARQMPSGGIVANVEIILPSQWIEGLARALLGRSAVALPAYQRRHLRWRVHELLEAADNPWLRRYLDAEGSAVERARRRYQLADRLAGQFTQYLVYRPDWLRAWERGERPIASSAVDLSEQEALLASLWVQVREHLGPHRAALIGELVRRLDAGKAPLPTLHVFGTSHIAPAELAVLEAYARQAVVVFYVPDPCREHWAGLALDALRESYREAEQARIDAAGDGEYWTAQEHPLLARWGRLGQHFFSGLASAEVDVRHWQDESPDEPRSRLERVQESIRRLQPALLGSDPRAAAEWSDASLRVHACHTRLRELEVLRDVLLDAIDHADIQPHEMLVMAPDIQAYAPLIPAVFGTPGRMQGLLPYHIADVAVAHGHRMFDAFRRLLDIPAARIAVPDIVDLLRVPEIALRLGIDGDAMECLSQWLAQSRAAWALDAVHRASFGVPAIREHTLAWAIDRMVAGYVLSAAPAAEHEQGYVLADGCELAPIPGIHGPAAEALGALDALLQALQTQCELAHQVLPASEWARLLEQQLDALFRADAEDRDSRDAAAVIRQFIRALATDPAGVGLDPALHYAVVRDLLVERLDAVPERQRWLMAGVTFCGMVPQRAIPFKMIAVLGLNDGEFPRSGGGIGLDPMRRLRRVGDRDTRLDDRYLFLETVMSARERLHLSYIGEGVNDGKPRNPAAPLVELLSELDRHAGLTPGDAQPRPWHVGHPLQPFDARYFDGADCRLFSYSSAFAGMHAAVGDGQPWRFIDPAPAPAVADTLPPSVALAEVARYFRAPAQYVCERRLKLRLDALADDGLREDEPLEARLYGLDRVAQRVFFNEVLPSWPDGPWTQRQAPDWIRLTGLLPPGRLGEAAWQAELEVVNQLLAAAQGSGMLDAQCVREARTIDVDVALDGAERLRISGRIARVMPLPGAERSGWQLLRGFPRGDGSGLKTEAELSFAERVPLFLDWALLRLATLQPTSADPVRLTLLLGGDERPWLNALCRWDQRLVAADPSTRARLGAVLEQRVGWLVRIWQRSAERPPWYFPKTSWELVRPLPAGRRPAPAAVWLGGHVGGERDYAPGYNHLLSTGVDLIQGPEAAALAAFAAELNACITLDAEAAA